jgi:hypothetical protein
MRSNTEWFSPDITEKLICLTVSVKGVSVCRKVEHCMVIRAADKGTFLPGLAGALFNLIQPQKGGRRQGGHAILRLVTKASYRRGWRQLPGTGMKTVDG